MTLPLSSWTRTLIVNLVGGPLQISISAGEISIVAGPNGTGKSALLSQMYRSLGPGQAEYLPGHRKITFDNENLDWVQMPVEQLTASMFANPEAHGRYKSIWSEDHFKLTMKGLLQSEYAYSGRVVEAVQGMNSHFLQTAQHERTPLQRLNYIFKAARLPIDFFLNNGSFRARKDGQVFTVDRLSDGERAALLLVSAVLSRPNNSVLLIDEPEKHLNPAISGTLIYAAARARPDLGYILATHDLPLIETLDPKTIVHVRNSSIISTIPEQRVYDLGILEREDGIDDDLRSSILGSRKAVLYVEGAENSFDKLLYSLVYPEWNVVSSGGWETVVQYVRTLRQNGNFHWLRSHGLIDGDGRDDAEKLAFAAEGIHCLRQISVEGLMLDRKIVSAMAPLIFNVVGGKTGDTRLAEIEAFIPSIIQANKDRIIAKRTAWKANRQVSSSKVSTNDVMQGQAEVASIDLLALHVAETANFDTQLSLDPFELLALNPVKDTAIPAKIANALGFASFGHYKQAVIKQIEDGTEAGQAILQSLRNYLPILPAA